MKTLIENSTRIRGAVAALAMIAAVAPATLHAGGEDNTKSKKVAVANARQRAIVKARVAHRLHYVVVQHIMTPVDDAPRPVRQAPADNDNAWYNQSPFRSNAELNFVDP